MEDITKRIKGGKVMSKLARKRRDGSGPFKGSNQEQKSKVGKRKQAGEPCPKKK